MTSDTAHSTMANSIFTSQVSPFVSGIGLLGQKLTTATAAMANQLKKSSEFV